MFEFRLGSIRVTVRPSHFLGGVLIALTAIDSFGTSWPGRILANPQDPARVRTQIAVGAIWIAIVFVSVLFHEFGHAVAMRAFRYAPSIQLVFLGGYTSPNSASPLPWGRDVVTTLAGPIFGAGLGWVCQLLLQLQPGEVLTYVLASASVANFVWAVFNMVPVLPLDGGRISMAILSRLFGRAGMSLAYLLGIAVCGAALYFSWRSGGSGMLLVFGLLFAFQNVQGLLAVWRSEPPVEAPAELVEAERLFAEGKNREARAQLDVLHGREVPAAVASRLHHLLGWIALREGEGRRALDHFSQVQGRPVERHALAAAFSLIGDEARALPLWEQAYKDTQDPGVLREWAGALLRAGQTDQAERLPGVDLAGAYAAAEKMAFLRGAHSEAARFGQESFSRLPTAERAYDVACALARAGDSRRAMEYLNKASALGYSDVAAASTDPDLAALHGLPTFDSWLKSLGKNDEALTRP